LTQRGIDLRGIGSIAMTGSAARDRIFGALILALGETIGGDIAGADRPVERLDTGGVRLAGNSHER
jgi:hypothetical protein